MIKTAKFIIFDILKNKIVLGYTAVLFLISWTILGLEANESKATLSLLNVVILLVPLVCIMFSTIYVYNSSQFIELLLSHPIARARIWLGIFVGLSLALILAFLLGCALPIFIYSSIELGLSLIISGVFLSAIFTALAMLTAIITKDRAKGVGLAIFIWIFLSIIYDGILMVLMFQLADYPIESLMATLTAVNPVGLSRIFVLLQLDVAAMLGATGAIFKQTFGIGGGMGLSLIILSVWVILPLLLSLVKFNKKDL